MDTVVTRACCAHLYGKQPRSKPVNVECRFERVPAVGEFVLLEPEGDSGTQLGLSAGEQGVFEVVAVDHVPMGEATHPFLAELWCSFMDAAEHQRRTARAARNLAEARTPRDSGPLAVASQTSRKRRAQTVTHVSVGRTALHLTS
jgi:hypothetical protein